MWCLLSPARPLPCSAPQRTMPPLPSQGLAGVRCSGWTVLLKLLRDQVWPVEGPLGLLDAAFSNGSKPPCHWRLGSLQA